MRHYFFFSGKTYSAFRMPFMMGIWNFLEHILVANMTINLKNFQIKSVAWMWSIFGMAFEVAKKVFSNWSVLILKPHYTCRSAAYKSDKCSCLSARPKATDCLFFSAIWRDCVNDKPRSAGNMLSLWWLNGNFCF